MPRALPIAKQSKSLEKQPRWRGVGIRNGGVELFKMQDAICSRMYELSWVRHAEVCQTPPVCQTLGARTPTREHYNFMNPQRPVASRRAGPVPPSVRLYWHPPPPQFCHTCRLIFDMLDSNIIKTSAFLLSRRNKILKFSM